MVKHGTIWQDNNIRLVAIFVAQYQKFLCLNAKRMTLGFSQSKNTYVSLSIKAKREKKALCKHCIECGLNGIL